MKATGRAVGRPSKVLSEETRGGVLACLRLGVSLPVAAEAAGIDATTLRRWLERGRAGQRPYNLLLIDAEKAIAEAELRAAHRIATSRRWQAAAWRLERQHPERWGRSRREATLADVLERPDPSGVLEHLDLSRLAPEERARAEALLAKAAPDVA